MKRSTSMPLNRLNQIILGGFFLITASLVFWGVVRAPAILAREDNPRLVTAELAIRRGDILDRNGRILAESRNIYETDNPAHLAFHERNRQRGRMSGQVRIRVRYQTIIGPWFDYLMVSPDEMRQIVADTGWHVAQITRGDEGGMYTAVLEKAL